MIKFFFRFAEIVTTALIAMIRREISAVSAARRATIKRLLAPRTHNYPLKRKFGVFNIDTDVAGVTATPSGGSTNVTEGGATDTVQVALNTRPAPGNQVVISVQPQPQLDLGAGAGNAIELTFDTNNWNTPQIVTVGAPDNSSKARTPRSSAIA